MGPDRDRTRDRPFDTLTVFLKDFLKKLILIKSHQMITKVSKNIQLAELFTCTLIEIIHGAVFVT